MTEKFLLEGLKALYLTTTNAQDRNAIKNKLKKREINYLFVVDIFNEGVDIPEVDTVLFLRPTESLTIFIQQFGRGLRLADGKESLTVLDFVGNARPEYSFGNKFRALIGKTNTPVQKEIEDNFPHLPLGCSIILEKKAKEIILQNIISASRLSRQNLINKITQFKHDSSLKLTLKNFIDFYNIPLEFIYGRSLWSRLCYEAKELKSFDEKNEKEISSAIQKKWLTINSISYFKFILKLARNNFIVNLDNCDTSEKKMLLMLHYDVWKNPSQFTSLQESIKAIGLNNYLVSEIIELMELLIDKINHDEKDISLPYAQPLKVHSRYTRDQILSAFGLNSFEYKYPSREGVVENKDLNTELLFINLIKSEENFSPTTMYDDYAISEYLFHWQSQNSTSPGSPKGLSYINHKANNKHILLFIREKTKNEHGVVNSYVFVGDAMMYNYKGSKPMDITWQLKEPLPNYLWHDAVKLQVG